jgi:hypothetical protein
MFVHVSLGSDEGKERWLNWLTDGKISVRRSLTQTYREQWRGNGGVCPGDRNRGRLGQQVHRWSPTYM